MKAANVAFLNLTNFISYKKFYYLQNINVCEFILKGGLHKWGNDVALCQNP